MKTLKRFTAVLAALLLVLSFSGCIKGEEKTEPSVKLFLVEGFTDMTAEKLAHDHADTYAVTVGTEDEARAAVLDGSADAAICSLSSAVKLYGENNGVRIAAGSPKALFVVSTDGAVTALEQLEGKNLLVSSANDDFGTVNYILKGNRVKNVTLVSPAVDSEKGVFDELSAKGGVGILSEPYASRLKASAGEKCVLTELSSAWRNISSAGEPPVTCCLVLSSEFAGRSSEVSALLSHYQVSVNYLFVDESKAAATDMMDYGVFTAADNPAEALVHCGAAFTASDALRFGVAATLEALGDDGVYNGSTVPDNSIFY